MNDMIKIIQSLMLADKKLTDFTNLFSPCDLDKNDSIILSYFKNA